MTIINRGSDRPTGLCTAAVPGKNMGCQRPRVPSSDSSLCARHLLIAANDVKQLTPSLLVSIVQKEGM